MIDTTHLSNMGFFNNKNVLVTGAAGLCGHAAVKRLLDEGAYVKAVTHTTRDLDISPGKRNMHDSHLTVEQANLLDYDSCLSVTKDIDIVVNFVAFLRGAKGQSESPADLVRRNVVPNINIIDAACKNKVNIFGFVGSSTCYPDVTYPVLEAEGFKDEPHSVYAGVGWMKRYCEKVCMHLHDVTDTKFAMIRTTAIYGPHDTFDPEKCHAIPHLILKASAKNNPYEIWGDGHQIRDFVYVDDVVDGLLQTIKKYPVADPVNIATGTGTNVTDLVKTITDIYEYTPEFIFNTDKPTMIPVRLVSVSKAKKILNWTSNTNLRDGLKKTIDWYETTS